MILRGVRIYKSSRGRTQWKMIELWVNVVIYGTILVMMSAESYKLGLLYILVQFECSLIPF